MQERWRSRLPCAPVLWLAVVAGTCARMGVGVAPRGYEGRSAAASNGGACPTNLQWLPRLRGGGDARPAASTRRAREARGAAFFQEMQREVAFAEFREPDPEGIVAVPQDEADARFAIAATPNGGCTYFAAENAPCPTGVGGPHKTGSRPGGPLGALHEHRWEDQIDVHESRCVNIVCEARASESSCPPCAAHSFPLSAGRRSSQGEVAVVPVQRWEVLRSAPAVCSGGIHGSVSAGCWRHTVR